MKEFFKKIGSWCKNHKKLVIFLIILILLGVLIGYIVHSVKEAAKMLTDMATAGEVVQIERRDLVNSLSATGTVVSLDSSEVYADVNGVEVMEIPVSVGDYVKEGDVICIMDSSDLETNLANAKANLAAKDAGSNSDVATAKRHLNEAVNAEGITVSRNFDDLQDLYDDYLEAVDEYDQAVTEYNTATEMYNYRAGEYQNFLDDHTDLEEIDRERLPDFSFYKGKFTEAESEMKSKKQTMEAKEDAVDAALDKYNNLIRSYEDNVRNNDSGIMDRNDSLNSAKRNSSVSGLTDEQQIKQYEDQIEACTVKAPRDGVITSISVSEGVKYTGAAIATIEDDTGFKISSEIEEYDIAKIKVGQSVVIKTNGTGDIELDGKISEIAPRATKVNNVTGSSTAANVTYKVKIDVLSDCDDLKMDMTAKLSIIMEEKKDVLTVPYDAVQTDEDGNFYIEKANENSGVEGVVEKYSKKNDQSGQQTVDPAKNRIYVSKGIESDYYVEVIGDGVEEGVSIVVPSTNGINDFMQMMMDQGAMGGM